MKEYIISIILLYILPGCITMLDAINQSDSNLASFSFIPFVNMISGLVAVGNIIYRFFI